MKSVSWDNIHADRFSLAPYELYQEIVRSAEVRIARHDAEAERRQARLGTRAADDDTEAAEEEGADAGEDEDSDFAEAEADPGNNYARILSRDKHLDIDLEFKFPEGRDKDIKRPSCWNRVVRMANEIHISEMRLSMLNKYCT